MSQGPYDIFLSYRTADKAWVRKKLLPAIEASGLRVCIDFRDFELGASLTAEMERSVVQSRLTVAVLTPAYLTSGFTEFERDMAQYLGLEARERRLITIFREGAQAPLSLRAFLMLDMSDDDEFDIALARLTAACAPAAEGK